MESIYMSSEKKVLTLLKSKNIPKYHEIKYPKHIAHFVLFFVFLMAELAELWLCLRETVHQNQEQISQKCIRGLGPLWKMMLPPSWFTIDTLNLQMFPSKDCRLYRNASEM